MIDLFIDAADTPHVYRDGRELLVETNDWYNDGEDLSDSELLIAAYLEN